MYRLTQRMQQEFRGQLEQYHRLLSRGRCSNRQLEDLLCRAIRLDDVAQHHASRQEGRRNGLSGVAVNAAGDAHFLQVKSGSIGGGYLTLSGHRMGRFNGDLRQITDYLNGNAAEIISVSYRKADDDQGPRHIYQIAYADVDGRAQLQADGWAESGQALLQTNHHGVIFSLRPSAGWQVRRRIPETLVEQLPEMVI